MQGAPERLGTEQAVTTENGFSRTTIEFPEGEYMRRWVFQCPWFTVRLHKINMADEYSPHNHPWNFMSVILKGRYDEERYYVKGQPRAPYGVTPIVTHETVQRRRFRPVLRSKDDFHRVIPLDKYGPTWTFVITGPKRKIKFATEQRVDASWGFLNEDGTVTHWRFHKDNRPTVDAEGTDLNG